MMEQMPGAAPAAPQGEAPKGGENPFTETVARVSEDLTSIADALEQVGEGDASGRIQALLAEYQAALQDIAKGRGAKPQPKAVDANGGPAGVPVP